MSDDEPSDPVPVPADVDQPDKIVAGLTARQAAILAAAAAVLWLAWLATRRFTPLPVFAAAAAPFAVAAVVVTLGARDGLSADRWLAAGLRQARAPRRLIPAPGGIAPLPGWLAPTATAQARPLPAPLRLPADAISPTGAVSLGGDGAAAIAAASVVNFALRTPAEQQALTAAFGRWLNSLQHPAQILVRAHRIDLSAMAAAVETSAPGLPHPALERAAVGHAAFLARLAEDRDLLARQVLIAVRAPTPGQAARALTDGTRALAAAGVALTPLDGPQASAVLAACCRPGHPPPPAAAPGGQVITAACTEPEASTWPGA